MENYIHYDFYGTKEENNGFYTDHLIKRTKKWNVAKELINDFINLPDNKYSQAYLVMVDDEENEEVELFIIVNEDGEWVIDLDRREEQDVDIYKGFDDDRDPTVLYNNVYMDLVADHDPNCDKDSLGLMHEKNKNKISYQEVFFDLNNCFVIETHKKDKAEYARKVCSFYNGKIHKDAVVKDEFGKDFYVIKFKVDGIVL